MGGVSIFPRFSLAPQKRKQRQQRRGTKHATTQYRSYSRPPQELVTDKCFSNLLGGDHSFQHDICSKVVRSSADLLLSCGCLGCSVVRHRPPCPIPDPPAPGKSENGQHS